MTLYISTSPGTDELAARCVEVLEVLGGKAIEQYGKFIVSLAGGSTPKAIYSHWAAESRLDWGKVELWFGDERCVHPEHADSNYRMVAESLLAGLPASPEIVRIEGEHADPDQAARNYDHALREMRGKGEQIHVALLGVGGDGHTASLFPGMDSLKHGGELCLSTPAPDGGTRRITMTVPCLRSARKQMFIVSGQDKAKIMNRVLEGPLHPEEMPAQFFLRDDRLNVNLLLDDAAAAQLNRRE